jgi:AcrR family transcriptional regulator
LFLTVSPKRSDTDRGGTATVAGLALSKSDAGYPVGEKSRMQDDQAREQILDQALVLAETGSWERLTLHRVADTLGISLDDIRRHFAQKDDLAEAWFDRADRAVLRMAPHETPVDNDPAQRLEDTIMTWLEALAAHRRLTREMLGYKLEPGHIHLQALGVMRISRTVQWFREAARLRAHGLRRIVEEVALTGIYLASFARWLYDDSPDSAETRAFVHRALRRWPGGASRHNPGAAYAGTGEQDGPAASASPGGTVSMH